MDKEKKTGKGIRIKMIRKTKFTKSKRFISFAPPLFGKEEEQEVVDTLRSGWVTTGPKVKDFERRVARYVNSKYAVAAFSCTSAMEIALNVLGIKEGDEVITTPNTFASTGHVILYRRAKPVFVDIEPDTFNIDPDKIESKITERTRAILPVHFAGHPCDMDRILNLAKKFNLYVIEDAAHAIGSEYKGKKIGSLGDITCFSFYATKNLATAEGGMAVTNHEAWAKRMRILTMYGISDAREIWEKRYSKSGSFHYDIIELGYKCNMNDICAALGLVQLNRLEAFNRTRERFAKLYDKAFAGNPAIMTPVIKKYAKTNRHFYPILLNLDCIKIDRDHFVSELKAMNIGTSIGFKPLHLHSYYAKMLGHRYGDFPIAEQVFQRSVCLPISPKIGEESINKIIGTIIHLLRRHKR